MRINLNPSDEKQLQLQLDVHGVQERVKDALDVILEDAIAQLAERTPVGVYGAAQGGWHHNAGVTMSMTEAVAMTENVQPYVYYLIYGTRPARWNPGKHLIPWVEKKLSTATQYKIARGSGMSQKAVRRAVEAGTLSRSVAYAIGGARMKRGSKGHDFRAEVNAENERYWTRILQEAVFS